MCGAAGQYFTIAVHQSRHGDRRKSERQRNGFTQQSRCRGAGRHVDEHALAQLDALEILAIGTQRLLGVGARLGIIEERLGYPAAGEPSQILNAGDVFHEIWVFSPGIVLSRCFRVRLTGKDAWYDSSQAMDNGRFSLEGKRALVTGASRGIGRAIAEGLAGAGADVAITSRSLDRLADTAENIKAMGRRATPIAMDVAQVADCRAGVARAAEIMGGLDILVNNAGVEQVSPSLGSRRRPGISSSTPISRAHFLWRKLPPGNEARGSASSTFAR